MTRTISSSQTFLVKFVFPVLWCSIFGAVAIAMGTGVLHGAGNAAPPTAVTVAFASVSLVGAASFWWFYGRLKRVRLDDGALYISNYRREIRVPLTDIEEVSQNRWVNDQPVTIRFRVQTGFGSRIIFMPKWRLFALWRTHPIVAELQELALSARA